MKKLLGLLGVMSLVLILSACSDSKPEDVATGFVEAMYRGNADKMLTMVYLSDTDKEKAGVEDMVSGKFKQAAAKAKEEAERKGGIKTIAVKESNIDDANGQGSVTVNVEFKNDGAAARTERIKLIRSDKQWKIRL